MMGPVEVMIALIVIGLPVLTILYMAHRSFRFRERKLEVEAGAAAEKAAQYVARSSEIEQRLAVIERIVTDGPLRLSNEIDALSVFAQSQPRKDLA